MWKVLQKIQERYVLDTMLFVFAFIMVGYLASTIYALTLKELSSLKTATFILGILHLAWTLPDFISLSTGSNAHPPIFNDCGFVTCVDYFTSLRMDN